MRNISRFAIVAVYLLVCSTGLAAPEATASPTEEQIREKIKQRIPYRFEDEVHFTVAIGEAVALNTGAPDHDV